MQHQPQQGQHHLSDFEKDKHRFLQNLSESENRSISKNQLVTSLKFPYYDMDSSCHACHDQQAAVILLSLLSLALDSEAKLSQQDDPYFRFFYRYSVA